MRVPWEIVCAEDIPQATVKPNAWFLLANLFDKKGSFFDMDEFF